MEAVHNLEKTVAEWYKGLPHLPKELRTWLGTNVWWIVIVGVVLSVFAAFAAISALLIILGLGGLGAGLGANYGYGYGAAVSASIGVAWLWSLVALAGLVVTLVLMLMAINPLKAKAKRGWTLLFVVLLVNIAVGVVQGLGGFNIASIFFALLWGAVEGYFLFEIRDQFGKAPAKVEAAKK